MGSKSPDGHQQGPDGNGHVEKPCNSTATRPRNCSASADLQQRSVGDDDDADDSDEEAGLELTGDDKQDRKKKKRKPRKKKPKSKKFAQRCPLTIELSKLYPSGDYPTGQLVPYENTARTTDEEIRLDSRLWDDGFLKDYRKAAEIHRQVRQYVQRDVIHPGVTLQAIADSIETGVRNLSGHHALKTGDALQAGMGFPTGLCLNNIAAHWTPNPGGKDIVLQHSDVLKVDFGVHVNGRIVDSAFTICHDETYDPLLEAVKAATNTGIGHAGVDARMCEIGAAIQEVMESYEVATKDGKHLPIKAIRNITGHDILRYHIHGGKQVPFVKNDSNQKMEEGEIYAIETFGSTGTGYIRDDIGIYGYGRQDDVPIPRHLSGGAKSLLKTIDENFGSIVFCRRYLERLGVRKYHLGMKQLIDQGIVESYAPLVDREGSHVAQFEHTILLGNGGKEVVSRAEDY